MSRECERWEAWIRPDERHLEACSSCREQWRADQALAGLAILPRSELRAGFARRTRRRAEARMSAGLLSPLTRAVMRLYWLSATIVAGVILVELPGAAGGWTPAVIGLGVLAVAAAPALLFLHRNLRWSLLDLLIWTAR